MARDFKQTKEKKGLKLKAGYLILLLIMGLVGAGFLVMTSVVDAFPLSVLGVIIGMMVLLIALAWFLFRRRKKGWRIVGIVVAVIFLAAYGMGIYYLLTTFGMLNKISVDEPTQSSSGIDVTKDSYNIYITGIDQWAEEKGYDLERSDVNMIVTVNPMTRKVLLTSIPRDTYVPLHRTGDMDKLTHTGIYGVDETLNTVSDWLGEELPFYVKMNFTAVYNIIDVMGGIDVYSPKTFVPTKRPWYTVQKGWNRMDGGEALAFARERAAFDGEDAQRVENQQQVVKACLKKMMTSSTMLTRYGDILKVGGDNMETNISVDDMQAVMKMQLADLTEWDIEMQKIQGEYDMDKVASLDQNYNYLVYKTDPSSVKECCEAINAVLNPTDLKLREAAAERQKSSFFKFIKGLIKKQD